MKSYTDTDVELVANTLWVALGFSSNPPTDACYDDARRILTALVDAGWQKAEPARPSHCSTPPEASRD